MRWSASLFVGRPLSPLFVGAAFLAAYPALRSTSLGAGRHPRPLLVAAAGWMVYAGWEWLVQTRTPEANFRADLLLIWPALAIPPVWALLRALR